MEALVHNLLDDPLVEGLLVEARPVDDGLDGVGHVVDLLTANAPLPEVLGACAGAVLRTVAERLAGTVRADDLVVRLGGDEFAIAFADRTSPDSAAQLAARLVEVIRNPMALPTGPYITVGASVGLATAKADKVIQLADAALYDAKRTKRDPISHGTPRT